MSVDKIPKEEQEELISCYARFELLRRAALKDWSPESTKELYAAVNSFAEHAFWLGFIRGADPKWQPKLTDKHD